MRRVLRLTALLGIAVAAGTSAGCATAVEPAVVVHVAASADPAPLEVRLADPDGPFRASAEIRPGESRRFAVPAGWVTVRVAGRCVVPAPVERTAVVRVGHASCALG